MRENNPALYCDRRYRMRFVRGLIEQIKSDHADLIRLKEKLCAGHISDAEEEEFKQILCWLKQGMREYLRIKTKDMEGVLWTEIEQIEKDIMENNNGGCGLRRELKSPIAGSTSRRGI